MSPTFAVVPVSVAMPPESISGSAIGRTVATAADRSRNCALSGRNATSPPVRTTVLGVHVNPWLQFTGVTGGRVAAGRPCNGVDTTVAEAAPEALAMAVQTPISH